jgi:endonuclease/exonuclease/phosphatase (EEP) superfamily protein YafD
MWASFEWPHTHASLVTSRLRHDSSAAVNEGRGARLVMRFPVAADSDSKGDTVRTLLRRTVIAVAMVILLLAALAFALRWVDVQRPWEAALVSLLPWLAVTSLLAVVASLAAGSRRIAAAGLVMVVGLAAVLVPQSVAGGARVLPGRSLVVVSCNLKYGEAHAATLVADLTKDRAEVFMAEELTPQEVSALDAAGITSRLPYTALAPGPVASGVGIWSSIPLQRTTQVPRLFNHVAGGQVRFGPGVLPLLVVHIAAPWPTQAPQWSTDLHVLRSWLVSHRVAIVGGDFNSTVNHQPFRNLLSAGVGYTDAARDAHATIIRTYPAEPFDLPIIGIDHLLLARPLSATSFWTQSVPGTDHRAIVTVVRVPFSA